MKLAKRALAIVLVALMLVPLCSFIASATTVGDVTGDSRVNPLDYLMLKRHIIKTAKLTDEQLKYADINGDDRINALDYMLLKRAILGTYVITPRGYSSKTVGDAYEIEDNVFFQKYTINSGEFVGSESAVMMEFNPADGYIPMVFSATACNYWGEDSGVLATQYDYAVNKYGYDVVGIINGSFFSTDTTYGQYGLLNGNIISNGKVVSAHADHSDTVVAFDSNGNMSFVDSKLQFQLFLDGEEVPNGLCYLNKHSGHKVADVWQSRFYYYDTSCGANATTYAIFPGYEVICEKINNSELAVGKTLYGKVLEIKENSYGAALADSEYDMSDKFVLFVGAESPYAAHLDRLEVGEIVNIQTNETIAESREIMENANSVIPNVGFLVKDGVDQTQIQSTIGTHSVTLRARWTAFGQRADGSYVFMTSEGGSTGEADRSITLRDVAKFMIEQGCVNVIRMDGGGSSAMYAKDAGEGEPDYLQYSSRDVGDCILIVKKDSVKDEALETALAEKIEEAEALIEEYPNEAVEALLDEANALLAQDVIISGDVQRVLNELVAAMSGKDKLSALIAEVGSIVIEEYSEENLDAIREAYIDALAIFTDPEADPVEAAELANGLEALLATKGEGELVTGAIYATHFNTSILTGNVTFFTPDFGPVTNTTANVRWTRNMILTWDETENAYIVTETFLGGGSAKDVTLEENQLYIAAHEDEADPISVANIQNFEAAVVGQKLVLHSIDLANKSMGVLAYMSFENVG